MSLVAIGLNHRTAPLDLLERMSVSDAALGKALADLCSRQHVSEAVVLSTCNRTEVYASVERFHGAFHDIREWFAELAYLPPEEFGDHLDVRSDTAAVGHLFAVASGLDSAVLGEAEILGQVRRAWEHAQEEGAAGTALNLLFRHALEVGKRARTETGIARGTTSLSHAAVELAAEHLGGLAGRRVLVLGTGDMGGGIVEALAGHELAELIVANRTWSRAQELAAGVGGRAVRFGDVSGVMAGVDAVITSTGSPTLLFERADLVPVVEGRRDPLVVVDVAVPRDVDPGAATLTGLCLLDMDDLRAFADASLAGRFREAERVRRLCDAEVERYQAVVSAREVSPLVGALHARADAVRRAELDRLAGRLGALDARQREAVEALTRGIVAKLLHDPTVSLKDAAGTPRGERLAETLRELFDL